MKIKLLRNNTLLVTVCKKKRTGFALQLAHNTSGLSTTNEQMIDGLPGALRKREVQLRRGRVWNVEKVRDHLEVHGLSSRSSSKAHPRIQDWKKSRNNTWIICWIFRNVIRLSSEVVKFHKSSLITKKEINSSWKVNLKLTKWFVS